MMRRFELEVCFPPKTWPGNRFFFYRTKLLQKKETVRKKQGDEVKGITKFAQFLHYKERT